MSLWERLAKSREGQKIDVYAHGGPVEGAPFVDFREMEDRAEEAIKEYLATPLEKASRELELRACDGIIKYLLMNFGNLESCGELAISENLGIPRSRLRRLLANMEWNGIIEGIDVGKATPYVVRNISKAMKEGYLSLTESEAEKLMKIIHSMHLAAPYRDPRTLLIETVQSTVPSAGVFTETYLKGFKYALQSDPSPVTEQVHRPFNPGTVTTYHPGYHDFQLIQSFVAWPFQGAIIRELMLELGVPEKVKEEQIKEGLRRLGEKYLRLTDLSLKPLYELINNFGYVEAKKRIEKGLLRDRLLETTENVPRADVYWFDRLLEKRRIVPHHGLVTLQTEELTPNHVRLAANILLAACRFAHYMGVDPDKVEECSQKARVLLQAVQDKPPS